MELQQSTWGKLAVISSRAKEFLPQLMVNLRTTQAVDSTGNGSSPSSVEVGGSDWVVPGSPQYGSCFRGSGQAAEGDLKVKDVRGAVK